MKIIIVDDDVKRAVSIAAYLVENRCAVAENVSRVVSADAAKSLLRVQFFDALLLDVVLPKRENEDPSRNNSIDLLDQLHRRPGLKRPPTIIGLTSHSSDLGEFRESFGEYCTSVVEAKASSGSWKLQILKALNYSLGSQLSRATTERNVSILTIHGIRTFGGWQRRLKKIVLDNADDVDFQTYRYGYFSTLAFFLPFLRNREVKRFRQRLDVVLRDHEDRELLIFAHSFGTFIAAHALRQLGKDDQRPSIRTLVLAGSVLPARFNWSFIQKFHGIRVINDCGTRDAILWLCDAFVPLLGKAGRTGFYGFDNDQFVNRFFQGGHDIYFKGDSIMETFWVPLIDADRQIIEIDERKNNVFVDEILDKIVGFLSSIKELSYAAGVAYVLFRIYR